MSGVPETRPPEIGPEHAEILTEIVTREAHEADRLRGHLEDCMNERERVDLQSWVEGHERTLKRATESQSLLRSLVGGTHRVVSVEDLKRGKTLLRDVYVDIKELGDLEDLFDRWLSSVSTGEK